MIVPVKELALAKTRLVHFPADLRSEFALATARDVVAAARVCPLVDAVYVVTNDVLAAETLAGDPVAPAPARPRTTAGDSRPV